MKSKEEEAQGGRRRWKEKVEGGELSVVHVLVLVVHTWPRVVKEVGGEEGRRRTQRRTTEEDNGGGQRRRTRRTWTGSREQERERKDRMS
jgi:hypothetical protein